MKPPTKLRFVATVLFAVVLSGFGCTFAKAHHRAARPDRAPSTQYDTESDGFVWKTSCPVDCILISLAEQRLYVFGNHQLIAWSTISSGKPGHDTPTGLFSVTEKDPNHHSNLYNNASMPFFLRLTDGGVGMHAGVLPGYAASHGCIRLPEGMAHQLYEHVEPGTMVQIISDTIPQFLAPAKPATASSKPATPAVATD